MGRRASALLVIATVFLVLLAGCVQSTTERPNASGNGDAAGANGSVPNSSVNSSISDDLPDETGTEAEGGSGNGSGDPFAGLLQDVNRRDTSGNPQELEDGEAGPGASSSETPSPSDGGSDPQAGGSGETDTDGSGSDSDDSAEAASDGSGDDGSPDISEIVEGVGDGSSGQETDSDSVGSVESQDGIVVVDVLSSNRYEIRYENGTTEYVRPLGIAPPPTEGPVLIDLYEDIQNIRKQKECIRQWGQRTLDHVEKELVGQTIELEYDDDVKNVKKYVGRQAYVMLDGENFNRHLVREGYARTFDEGFSRQLEFTKTETAARKAARGFWQCRSGVNKNEKQPLVIAEIQQEAPQGSDQENLNDEFVVIENTGEEDIDMSSWSIHTGGSRSYTFPEEYVLGAGKTVTVHSGNSFTFRSSSKTARDLYWGSISPVWNDHSGTVILKDSSFDTVIRKEYGR